jgi:[acyl-carrier-protein] S-malonyltransferase
MAAFAVLKNHSRVGKFPAAFAAGLSMGEATALCAMEAMSFADGVRFVKNRGLYMDEASQENPGLMAAVLGLELKIVEAVCANTGAEVGNLNAPGQIVISGFRKNVEEAIEKLKAAGARKVIPLDVSGGFHSRCMDSACVRIGKALEGVTIQKPRVPVVSNLTARVASEPEEIRTNLIKQMNHRTLWEASIRFMIERGVRRFVEFAPGKVLKGLLKKIDPAAEMISLGTVEDFHALD